MMIIYFLIMGSVFVAFFIIGSFVGSFSAWGALAMVALVWGLPSICVEWCLYKRNLREAPLGILMDVEHHWVSQGWHPRVSELNRLIRQGNREKIVRGYERLFSVQQELVNRLAEGPKELADYHSRLKQKLVATRDQLEQWQKLREG